MISHWMDAAGSPSPRPRVKKLVLENGYTIVLIKMIRVKIVFDEPVKLKNTEDLRRVLVHVDQNYKDISDFMFHLVDRYATSGQCVGLFLDDFILHPSEVSCLKYFFSALIQFPLISLFNKISQLKYCEITMR